MSGCGNRRFEELLHAYELGMLTDQERGELEIHLLECSHCFAKVEHLTGAAQIMRRDSDIRTLVKELDTAFETEGYTAVERDRTSPTRRARLALIPFSAIAALLLLFFILKDWTLVFEPTQEVRAAENRLAIMYFDNLTDPVDSQKLAEIVTSLLTTSLSESRSLQVISSQRIYDILKQLGQDSIRVVDRQLASQVAAIAKARWMVTGSILHMRPSLMVSAQVADVSTGTLVGSQSVIADSTETVFSIADKLATGIRRDLKLPTSLPQEIPSVADVTTHSAGAYYYYIKGVDYYYKQYEGEAVECFRKALQSDSAFAMAYYYLAALDFTPQRDVLMAKAVTYADKASERERHYIRSGAALTSGDLAQAVSELEQLLDRHPDEKQALLRLGACQYYQRRYQEAINSFNAALALDSLYKEPYDFLAYAYDRIGNAEMSILAINKYVALAPNDAGPYKSRGDLYALNGRLGDAIRSYRKALEIKPDFWPSIDALGIMHVFMGDYVAAESCFHALANASDKVFRASARNDEAFLLLNQGRLREAVESLDTSISQDLRENLQDCANYKSLMKALVYEEQGKLDKAVTELDQYMAVAGPRREKASYSLYVKLLTDVCDTTRAAQVTAELGKDLEGANADSSLYWCACGLMERARGHATSSLAYLEKATKETRDFFAGYNLALGYLNSQKLAEAVARFEKLISSYKSQRLFYGTYNVKMHYYLGIAYEESNWHEKAIEQYQMFLNTWMSSDPGIKAVEDAKARLAHLRTRS